MGEIGGEFVEDNAVAACAFGGIHGAVGAVEHGGPAIVFGQTLGDSHADGGTDEVVFVGQTKLVNDEAEVLGDGDGVGGLAVGKEEEELFTSGAGEDIGGAQMLFEQVDEGAEEGVSCAVAVSVVDELEVIDVDGDDGEGHAGALAADHLVSGDLHEGAAVEAAGESVHAGGGLDGAVHFGCGEPEEHEQETVGGKDEQEQSVGPAVIADGGVPVAA